MKHTVRLADGRIVPAIGLGTWYLGENPVSWHRELEALRTGIKEGMTLIDTAEMYGSGRSERLVGEAISGMDRESLFVVSKVLPQNAGKGRIFSSCRASLKRLGTGYLDLYLLHWRGGVPLSETVACMEELKKEGLIRAWGVSNFDIEDMEDLWSVKNGRNCLINQVLYHPGSRGIEFSLLPWMEAHSVALMASRPLAQGGRLRQGLMESPAVREIAKAHGATPAQVLLAWAIRNKKTIAIPRSASPAHTRENALADQLVLSPSELESIDSFFPAPSRKTYLDIQ